MVAQFQFKIINKINIVTFKYLLFLFFNNFSLYWFTQLSSFLGNVQHLLDLLLVFAQVVLVFAFVYQFLHAFSE